MKENRHQNKHKGFSLIELSIVLLVAAILGGAMLPNVAKGLRIEAARKTALEMSQLQDAARLYFINNKEWPTDIDNLKTEGYLDPDWDARNPFGFAYQIAVRDAVLSFSTDVPQELTTVVADNLPMTTVDQMKVSSEISPPGGGTSVPAGTIAAWTSATIPDGWLVCDGQAVSRAVYPELFQACGTLYGAGDGVSTFNLPDLRGRTIIAMDNAGGNSANVITGPWADVLGGKDGEENHRLTIAEMPAHSHTYGHATVGGNYDGHSSPLFNYTVQGQTSSTGGDQAHNNIQPSMALVWIIKC